MRKSHDISVHNSIDVSRLDDDNMDVSRDDDEEYKFEREEEFYREMEKRL